jgi:hypothetical protein
MADHTHSIETLIDGKTRSARGRVMRLRKLPMEECLEEIREIRLELLEAIDAIEKGLALAATIAHVTGAH